MTPEQEYDLLARLDTLEKELEDIKHNVRQCEDGMDNLDQLYYELSDNTGRAHNIVERVETALLDITGINLAERLDATAHGLLRDGYVSVSVPPQSTAVNTPSTFREQHPGTIQWDVVQPYLTTPTFSATMGQDDLPADVGIGYVADGDVEPDDGAGRSETVSPDGSN